jgi:transposase, IS30 family
MRTYIQLTQEQRYRIYALKKTGHSSSEIADVIGVHKSMVSRELKRNRGRRGYRPQQAQSLAMERRQKGVPRITGEIWTLVEKLLKQDWSPEQISGRLKKEQSICISHEWIYQYVLKDKPVLVTLTERKSRFTLLGKVPQRTAQAVQDQIHRLLLPVADKTHTLTSDHGKEFAYHQQIAERLHLKFYFAHPYAAWERGTNENTNGLLRQYFPKKDDFQAVSHKQIEQAMSRLNFRPRKALRFKTPFEVFFHSSVALTS